MRSKQHTINIPEDIYKKLETFFLKERKALETLQISSVPKLAILAINLGWRKVEGLIAELKANHALEIHA